MSHLVALGRSARTGAGRTWPRGSQSGPTLELTLTQLPTRDWQQSRDKEDRRPPHRTPSAWAAMGALSACEALTPDATSHRSTGIGGGSGSAGRIARAPAATRTGATSVMERSTRCERCRTRRLWRGSPPRVAGEVGALRARPRGCGPCRSPTGVMLLAPAVAESAEREDDDDDEHDQ